MPTYLTPGVYKEDIFATPEPELRTGVPALLGYTTTGPRKPERLNRFSEFEEQYEENRQPLATSFLASAVRSFFENGGEVCYVVRLEESLSVVAALENGLAQLQALDTVDLICAPDIVRPVPAPEDSKTLLAPDAAEVRVMQRLVITHCDAKGDRFAILDSYPCKEAGNESQISAVLGQRTGLNGTNGALYFPWVKISGASAFAPEIKAAGFPNLLRGFVPPCGHVAGIYARSDQRVGVQKAPANEIVEGALDLEIDLTNTQQAELNPHGVNCLRAFPGRGIRVWGARTLSREPAWTYVNVRRLFLTAGRWIERNMPDVVFEPNDSKLWERIRLDLTTYFLGLFQRGALKGRTAQEAFYVKCNAETNPAEVREAGMVVTEIGLAPSSPAEFIIVRIVHGSEGIRIVAP